MANRRRKILQILQGRVWFVGSLIYDGYNYFNEGSMIEDNKNIKPELKEELMYKTGIICFKNKEKAIKFCEGQSFYSIKPFFKKLKSEKEEKIFLDDYID